ncbi:MAG: IS1634 family transposase [Clostridia bacterium]|nr:IS1634 family transposase [Clostridia bacterium]
MPVAVDNMRFFRSGPAALIARLCDVLKIAEIIDAVVDWDPVQCHLSPGNRVKALIINLLVNRKALYNVKNFYVHQDLEVLFGTKQQLKAEDFNDDALGRGLDKLFASGQLKKMFSSIALTAAATHNVPLEAIHVDTTSVSVQGAYEGEGDLDITFGFSKGHRPDLKQFLIGLTVNKDGLPILAQSLDGNSSDKSWYPKVIEELVQTFSPAKLKGLIFVADCALVTKDNLALLVKEEANKPALQFISLLPENFGLNKEVKAAAFETSTWQEIGKLSPKKAAACYKSQSFRREIDGREYRLIVVHSTNLDKRKEKSLAKKWVKQKETLAKAALELSQRPFACAADAQKAIELFCKEYCRQHFILNGTVAEEIVSSYTRPGRPKKGEQPQSTVVYYAHIEIEEDHQAMAREKDLAATFVLITNLMDTTFYPDRAVLKEYKEQNVVERQFRFLKQPFLLGDIFLKNKNRIKAMSFVFQLALLVAAYLEYRVRKNLKKEVSPLILSGERKSTNPTARALLEMFDYLMVVKQGPDRALINHHGSEVIRTLELAGFGKEIYLFPPRGGG